MLYIFFKTVPVVLQYAPGEGRCQKQAAMVDKLDWQNICSLYQRFQTLDT